MVRVLLACVLSAGLAVGADQCCGGYVSLSAPEVVEAYKLVRVQAADLPPKAGVVWRVTPRDGVDRADSPRGTLQFTAPPGSYLVELLVIESIDGEVKVSEASKTVTIRPPGYGTAPIPKQPNPQPNPQPQAKPDPVKATGRIRFGNAGCTATIIGKRIDGRWDVLTAAHCIDAIGQKGTLYTRGGLTIPVTVVTRDPLPNGSDISWLVTDKPVDSLPFAELAADIPPAGTEIWHNGYGIDKPENVESGIVNGRTTGGQLDMTLSVSSGDSGGGIFRKSDGKLVAVVCCTTERGAKVRMYGGHSVRAAELRPKTIDPKLLEDSTGLVPEAPGWIPLEIPACAK